MAAALSCMGQDVAWSARGGPASCSSRAHRSAPCQPTDRIVLLRSRQSGRNLQICNVTNEGTEMRVEEMYAYERSEFIELDQIQVPHPELGPLERRVSLSFEDALFSEEINPDDAQYWFTEPPGGWNQEPRRVRKGLIVPNDHADAKHFGPDRVKLDKLYPGQELVGTINRCMLYHGAQVDIGAEYDGLVPITEDQWVEANKQIALNNEVRVRIFKIHDTKLHRFPVQLEMISPDLTAIVSPPEEHDPALDLRGQSDMAFLEKYTGKTYKPSKFWANFSPSDAEMAMDTYDNNDEDGGAFEPNFHPSLRGQISDFAAHL